MKGARNLEDRKMQDPTMSCEMKDRIIEQLQ